MIQHHQQSRWKAWDATARSRYPGCIREYVATIAVAVDRHHETRCFLCGDATVSGAPRFANGPCSNTWVWTMKTLIDWLIGWPERVAQHLGSLAPLFARIVVGWAFLWSGWGKLTFSRRSYRASSSSAGYFSCSAY
jgi:hypothetical protein